MKQDGIVLFIKHEKNQTWLSIVEQVCSSVLINPNKYTGVGFEYDMRDAVLTFSGKNVPTKKICLNGIKIFEPAVAGTFLSHFRKLRETK